MEYLAQHPWLTLLVVVAFIVVSILALAWGGKVIVTVDPPRIKIRGGRTPQGALIAVLRQAIIRRTTVRNITGRDVPTDAEISGEINVGEGMTLDQSHVGDVSGVSMRHSERFRNRTTEET